MNPYEAFGRWVMDRLFNDHFDDFYDEYGDQAHTLLLEMAEQSDLARRVPPDPDDDEEVLWRWERIRFSAVDEETTPAAVSFTQEDQGGPQET